MSFSSPVPVELTGREREVLELVAQGLTNEKIGKQLILSQETIKSHVRHILGKLGASNRTNAVAIGIRMGHIDPGELAR